MQLSRCSDQYTGRMSEELWSDWGPSGQPIPRHFPWGRKISTAFSLRLSQKHVCIYCACSYAKASNARRCSLLRVTSQETHSLRVTKWPLLQEQLAAERQWPDRLAHFLKQFSQSVTVSASRWRGGCSCSVSVNRLVMLCDSAYSKDSIRVVSDYE